MDIHGYDSPYYQSSLYTMRHWDIQVHHQGQWRSWILNKLSLTVEIWIWIWVEGIDECEGWYKLTREVVKETQTITLGSSDFSITLNGFTANIIPITPTVMMEESKLSKHSSFGYDMSWRYSGPWSCTIGVILNSDGRYSPKVAQRPDNSSIRIQKCRFQNVQGSLSYSLALNGL